MVFSSFFDSAHEKIYVDIYLKSDVFYFYIHIRFNMIIRNVSCSFFLHIKYEKHSRQYLVKGRISSKYRVEPESKKGNVKDILNWLSIVRNGTPSFQSISYNLHAPIRMVLRKSGVTFYICFGKRGYPKRRGVPQRRGRGSSNPGGNYVRQLKHIPFQKNL